MTQRTGAEAIVTTLANCGVSVCFANPGTSEMHLVTALDREPRMRAILCLFEGVASGAADGYARLADRPAMTLLHLGSGLSNAGANIHNARRGRTPMVNVVGDHATYHLHHDAPLTSDLIGVARPNHIWAAAVPSAAHAGALAAQAYAAAVARAGPAALILPADSAWTAGATLAPAPPHVAANTPQPDAIEAAARAIRAAKKPVVLVNGSALRRENLSHLARLQAAGVAVFTDTFVARQARGAGRFAPARLQYFGEAALAELEGMDLMVLVGTRAPAAFFAYPGKPSLLVPEGCTVISAATEFEESGAAAAMLAEALGAPTPPPAGGFAAPVAPEGPLTPAAVGQSIARHMPEEAVVVDDGVTSGLGVFLPTLQARPHEWLMLTGGAIGWGPPAAVGAAVARPEAKVICLAGDGAAMYPPQAYWTMAREGLDVLTIVFANRSYRILNVELARTGAGNPGPAALSLLALDRPTIDFVGLAQAQGIAAARCDTAEDFDRTFAAFLSEPGPKLIEAVV